MLWNISMLTDEVGPRKVANMGLTLVWMVFLWSNMLAFTFHTFLLADLVHWYEKWMGKNQCLHIYFTVMLLTFTMLMLPMGFGSFLSWEVCYYTFLIFTYRDVIHRRTIASALTTSVSLYVITMWNKALAQRIAKCELKLWTILQGTESRVVTFHAETCVSSPQCECVCVLRH